MTAFWTPVTVLEVRSRRVGTACRSRATAVIRRIASFSPLVLLLSGAAAGTSVGSPDDLQQVLAQFDAVQRDISTLSAQFTEVTRSPLLKAPIVAEGRLFMTKPAAIRWEYTIPEEMHFVIFDDIYTGYFPAQHRAEKRNIQRYSNRLFRMFGLGQASSELMKFYEIRRAPEEDTDRAILLLLEPRKRRSRKRIDEVRFWISRDTGLPLKLEHLGDDGSGRTIEFHDVRINPDLAAALYTMEIPGDVSVTKGFSGLPDWSEPASP